MSKLLSQGLGEDGKEEEDNSVEEEESEGIEVFPSPVGKSEGTGRPTLAQYDKPYSHQIDLVILGILKSMTQMMATLQLAFSSEASRPTSLKTTECFDGTKPFKVRSFIQ
ncbi:hypothetical protein O181_121999 [Austropuccinia psidii MF-1]|uniref:Uncharacterized protein n=1 Tax=Austropuccinia psidii MF-1 TaxID=1389203 RepID=A0A9Q3KJQ0_9BASI|nr:hypothetical protein [Austropuccinia psidii MF-1]